MVILLCLHPVIFRQNFFCISLSRYKNIPILSKYEK
ncbi:Uncharacterised protein [Yersinia intermedia]|nr:Uncharacterised protein [Yersinia intermedia]